jgi:hypothetical protein
VLPRPTLATERFLHLDVGPQGRIATLDNAMEATAQYSLSRRRAAELVAEVWRVVREWKQCFEKAGVAAEDIEKVAPAFRHVDAISTAGVSKGLPWESAMCMKRGTAGAQLSTHDGTTKSSRDTYEDRGCSFGPAGLED